MIDLERLNQLRQEDLASTPLPDTGFASYDVSDGLHAAEIVDVGFRVTSQKKVPQLFLRWKIVSNTRDKGHTPYQSFNIPDADTLRTAIRSGDDAKVDSLLMGLTIFNSAYVYITGLPAFPNVGALAQAIASGSLKTVLVGKRAEIEASHNGPYLSLRVRRALGKSPSEISRPMPEPTAKPTRPRTTRKPSKRPPRKRK